MLKDLIKVANRLDLLGHRKEADKLDSIIKKIAGSSMTPKEAIKFYTQYPDEWREASDSYYTLASGEESFERDYYPTWNDDDFKSVIYAVDGPETFARVFGDREAGRIISIVNSVGRNNDGSKAVKDNINFDIPSDDEKNLIEMEKNISWEKFGLTNVSYTEEDAIRNYVADLRGRNTGLYGYNNGSYVILPHTPGMRPKKYIKQGDGARAYSGLRQEDAMRDIQNLINNLGYIDVGLPVPSDYRSILER